MTRTTRIVCRHCGSAFCHEVIVDTGTFYDACVGCGREWDGVPEVVQPESPQARFDHVKRFCPVPGHLPDVPGGRYPLPY